MTAFADKFDRDVTKWGGRHIRFHDPRHTAATLMLSKGVDVKTVMEILGREGHLNHDDLRPSPGDKIKQVSKSFSIRPAEQQNPRPKLQLISNP